MKKKRILITGGYGWIGFALTKMLVQQGFEVISLVRIKQNNHLLANLPFMEANLLNAIDLKEIIQNFQPIWVIHTAAVSKPDACEANKENCYTNNVTLTEIITSICKELAVSLLFFSTDFVFGNGGPHKENATYDPLNYYGYSKMLAEKYIADNMTNYAIVRPVFVYGITENWQKPGFLQWVIQQLAKKLPISVVNDQVRTPVALIDLLQAMLIIIQNNHYGTFNIAGNQLITPYHLASFTAQKLNLPNDLIIPTLSTSMQAAAEQPLSGGLKNTFTKEKLNWHPAPTLNDAFCSILDELEAFKKTCKSSL